MRKAAPPTEPAIMSRFVADEELSESLWESVVGIAVKIVDVVPLITVVAIALVIVVWKLPEEDGDGDAIEESDTKALGNDVGEKVGLAELDAELGKLEGGDDGAEEGSDDGFEDGSDEGGRDEGSEDGGALVGAEVGSEDGGCDVGLDEGGAVVGLLAGGSDLRHSRLRSGAFERRDKLLRTKVWTSAGTMGRLTEGPRTASTREVVTSLQKHPSSPSPRSEREGLRKQRRMGLASPWVQTERM